MKYHKNILGTIQKIFQKTLKNGYLKYFIIYIKNLSVIFSKKLNRNVITSLKRPVQKAFEKYFKIIPKKA